MMRIVAFSVLLFCATSEAAPWVFDAPIQVTATSANNVFTHLESAGRKNIAVSAGWAAVIWEDNRDGVPRAYVALKGPDQSAFGNALRISGNGEAAEPVIVGLGGGQFVMAWEEAGHIAARTLMNGSLGAVIEIGKTPSMQLSLAYDTVGGLFAVWSEQGARYWEIKLAKLKVTNQNDLISAHIVTIDASAKGDQAYPSIAVLSAKKTVVAWEDRRSGHTRMFYAVSTNGGKKFVTPKGLNEFKWRGKSLGYGSGTGAMRVALAAQGHGGAVAVWADKRDFPSGYDVYAGLMQANGASFGANEKVQDEFGNNIAQWHPAIAANAKGRIAAVWDDDRDGTPDLWLSWRNADGWQDNLAVPGASGAGVQSDPSIAMDDIGNLYIAWVEKADLNAPSGIRYVFGRVQ